MKGRAKSIVLTASLSPGGGVNSRALKTAVTIHGMITKQLRFSPFACKKISNKYTICLFPLRIFLNITQVGDKSC